MARIDVFVYGTLRPGGRFHDRYCRGVVVLGLEAPEAELIEAFRVASSAKIVKGFAVGRTIFAGAAEEWLAGRMGDAAAVTDMAAKFQNLVSAWEEVASVETARTAAQ